MPKNGNPLPLPPRGGFPARPRGIAPFLLPALLALLLCAQAAPAWAVQPNRLTKSLPLAARDMEFYYRKPIPPAGLLRAFDAADSFKNGEARLLAAAFFGELMRGDDAAAQQMMTQTKSLSADGRRMLAWAVHFSGGAGEGAVLDSLLSEGEAPLRRRIERSPARIDQWDMSEATVLRMFWACFYASGDTRWVDRIIAEALRLAGMNAQSRQTGRGFEIARSAAATLYDMAPRHPAVHDRLAAALSRAHGAEADILKQILRQK
ncbi:MAG: translation initiation factor 2 [Desulfovibrio sp.]|nr:translation initiation factor 2 [Desulfovibrio sp.]